MPYSGVTVKSAGASRTQTQTPKVGIVTINWNQYADTSRLLLGLKAVSYPDFCVYVVDNGSQDGSGTKLRDEFSSSTTKFVFNDENLGFSAGCNRGSEVALADGCDYILLLNNDCVVSDEGFLEKAVRFADARPQCGILGGKVLFWPETNRIWSTGGYIGWLGTERYVGLGEIDRGQHQQISERTFISGCLMLIKRQVVERIGMLSEAYFSGREDWEYSRRALRAGFKLFYYPEFTVYHQAGHSHAPTNLTPVYTNALGKILFLRRNRSRLFFQVWVLLYRFYLRFLFPARFLFRPERSQQRLNSAKIRWTMVRALQDSAGLEMITREMVESFRQLQSTHDVHG